MGFINVFVEKPCKILVEKNNLKLIGDAVAEFAIEDINSLMLENNYSTVTTSALSKLCAVGAVVFVCDEKHLPCGILTPFSSYYKKLNVLEFQLKLQKPKQKRLWQDTVIRKIENQSSCLKLTNKNNYINLQKMLKDVQSGDVTNIEAKAARVYFASLFGNDFTRSSDNIYNSAMNYTYAIVRGLIARTLACHGFECSIGLFHKNQLNAFNLVDDLIEPYRGVIDYFVINTIEFESDLNPSLKKKLYNVMNIDVKIDGNRQSLNRSVDIMVSSYLSVLTCDQTELKFPSLLPLEMHCYE